MEAFAINPAEVRDISETLLDEQQRLRVVAAETLASTTREERLLFGVRHGIYSFPTQELVGFLKERIAGRGAIEIGAGHGVLAAALNIPATDNRQQEEPAMRAYYKSIRQPTVPYGENVEKLDALTALRRYRPRVVVACWVTHVMDPKNPGAGRSATGVDEAQLIAECDEYIFIGNEHVHHQKPIWSLPHEKLKPAWLYSRAANGTKDFVAMWRRRP